MRIGILSDTHDRLKRAQVAVKMLVAAGAEALCHCGDLTGPDIVYACADRPAYFVFGNNDYDERALRRAMAEIDGLCLGWGGEVILDGKRLAITHGHLGREVRRLTALQPDYLLFGHSHHATDERDGVTRCINPGALSRAAQYTVALLDLETDDLQFLTVEHG